MPDPFDPFSWTTSCQQEDLFFVDTALRATNDDQEVPFDDDYINTWCWRGIPELATNIPFSMRPVFLTTGPEGATSPSQNT